MLGATLVSPARPKHRRVIELNLGVVTLVFQSPAKGNAGLGEATTATIDESLDTERQSIVAE